MHSIRASFHHNGSRWFTLLSAVAVVLSWTAASTHATDPANAGKSTTLVYMLTDPGAEHGEKLSACDRLTIAEYKKLGVRVVAKTESDLESWLAEAGKKHAKAAKGFQHVAFAAAHHADAIGGLTSMDITEEDVAGFPEPLEAGVYFQGWGVALGAAFHNTMYDLDFRDKVSAIPLKLAPGKENPWGIATEVVPSACSASGDGIMPGSDRAFLGVSMNDSTVIAVTANSSAKSAGLIEGDEFVSIDGAPITDIGSLGAALREKKPGDKITLAYERENEAKTTEITLTSRAVVMAANSPVGKPLPNLVGKDIHGKEVSLADLRGKVVLLDFWATWCGPCVEEAPMLQLLWERAKGDDFVWVGVSVDDDKSAWKNFVKHNQLGGIQLLSPEWGETMAIDSYPTILLVDGNGIVQCNVRGEQIAQGALAMLAAK